MSPTLLEKNKSLDPVVKNSSVNKFQSSGMESLGRKFSLLEHNPVFDLEVFSRDLDGE